MQFRSPGSQQVPTVFGGEYVAEQHADEAERNLAAAEGGAAGVALAWLGFYVVIVLAAMAQKIDHLT
jgi:hypothetical protein